MKTFILAPRVPCVVASILIVTSTIFTEKARAQTPDDIILKYLNTVSGDSIGRWSRVRSAYIEGISNYNSPAYNSQPDFVKKKTNLSKKFIVWPDKSKTELYEDSVLTSQFFNVGKKHFFVIGNMPPVDVSPGPYEPHFDFDPVRIKKLMAKAKRISLVGVEDFSTGPCYDIEIKTTELVWHFYFNQSTFLLDYWANSTDGSFDVLTHVFDYQEVSQLLVPMSETKITRGNIFFSSTISKIEFNVSIPDSIFNYPGK